MTRSRIPEAGSLLLSQPPAPQRRQMALISASLCVLFVGLCWLKTGDTTGPAALFSSLCLLLNLPTVVCTWNMVDESIVDATSVTVRRGALSAVIPLEVIVDAYVRRPVGAKALPICYVELRLRTPTVFGSTIRFWPSDDLLWPNGDMRSFFSPRNRVAIGK